MTPFSVNDSLEADGILRVHGEAFSLLALETEIHVRRENASIHYLHQLICDGEYAWALGTDDEKRAYALQIGYKPALEGGTASLKLYYTEPLEDLPQYGACTLLSDGRIALAGGIDGSNYQPYASVYIFDPRQATLAADTGTRARSAGIGAACSYRDYVNGYRIRFAQKKLLEEPQMRLSDIADAAGFASESAFYRNFKALTGQTPAEWLAASN